MFLKENKIIGLLSSFLELWFFSETMQHMFCSNKTNLLMKMCKISKFCSFKLS